MIRNRKRGAWLCGLLVVALTLVNSFACVIYCQFSQRLDSPDRHSCCARNSNHVISGSRISARRSCVCPADPSLLSDVPLILQNIPQPGQRNRAELSDVQASLVAGCGVVSSRFLATSSKFTSVSSFPSNPFLLLKSALRI